jgi:hypothetical protein
VRKFDHFRPSQPERARASEEYWNMTALPIGFSRQGVAALLSALPSAKSSLVRRLVAATDDPAKRRIREWLGNLGDERLSGLGLTPQDILVLRGGQGPHPFSP